MNNSKVQIQSWEIPFVSCYQWSAFCRYGTEATHCLGSIVCIDKWRQQINVKRRVNHHPLTLQLHPGAVGHQSHLSPLLPPPQLASLQEQLDSLLEKWPPGGSPTSSSTAQTHREEGGGEEPSSKEEGVFQLTWFVIPFSLSFPYITATAY